MRPALPRSIDPRRPRRDGDLVTRRALVVSAAVIPATTLAIFMLALVSGTGALMAWAGLGCFVTAATLVERSSKRPDLLRLTAVTAVGIRITAPFAPSSSVIAVVAAALLVSVVFFAVSDLRRSTTAWGVVVFGMLGWTLIATAEGAGSAVAMVVLAAGSGIAWLILKRLVERVREEHGSYRQLFDRVPVGLYRTGLGGELLDVNPALADLLGMTRDELIGRHAQEFFVDVDDFAALRATIGDRPDPLTTDIRFRRPDGGIIWVRDQTRPVTDDQGRIVCFEGELQDVTDQRRHLEELEALVKSKSELIGAVSHELRTPLTAVLGFLELLQSGEADEEGELLALAVDQARDVAGIVDDLLTAARLENRELVFQETLLDLPGAVDGAVTSVVGAGRAGIQVDLPDDLTVWADPARVRQVVRNLVSNAVRYGSPPVTIRAGVVDGMVELTVCDRGTEIPEAVSLRMFDAFFSGSGDGSTRQPGSIGLGLAVSQRLARLMGGDLRYARVDDETRFTLSLPTAVAEELAETA